MKSFDEKFSDHVRDVFDRYHEEVDPAMLEGMRVRLRSQRAVVMKSFYYRLLSAAVVLIIFSGLLYFGLNFEGFDSDADQPTALQNISPEPKISPIDSLQDESKPTRSQLPRIPSINLSDEDTKNQFASNSDDSVLRLNDYHEIDQDAEQFEADLYNRYMGTIGSVQNIDSDIQLSLRDEMDYLSVRELLNDYSEKLNSDYMDLEHSQNLIHTNYEISEPAELYFHRRGSNQRQSTQFMVGSSANFANEQITQGAGFLAGVVHFWNISNKISLSTGGLLSVNHIQFSVETRDQGILLDGGQISTLADGDEINLMVGQDYDIRYTAIDIPINTRYLLGTWGNGNYNFTVGLSSLVYIQQSTHETGVRYRGVALANAESGEININISSSEYKNTEKSKVFDSIDLAKLMNVSLGYSSVRNQDKIEIELYIKYPLGEITTRNLAIGMGGLTVKYRL